MRAFPAVVVGNQGELPWHTRCSRVPRALMNVAGFLGWHEQLLFFNPQGRDATVIFRKISDPSHTNTHNELTEISKVIYE